MTEEYKYPNTVVPPGSSEPGVAPPSVVGTDQANEVEPLPPPEPPPPEEESSAYAEEEPEEPEEDAPPSYKKSSSHKKKD